MVVRRQSSSNFSLGTLFHTSDGGEHWTELPLPLGEPVVFSSAQIGFQVGGTPGTSPTTDLTSPSMDSNVYAQFLESATNLYRTVDGGKTWQVLDLLTNSNSGYDAQYPHYQLPLFRDPQHGLLPVLTDDEVIFFATDDGGLSWSLAGRQALASPQPEFANLPFSLRSAAILAGAHPTGGAVPNFTGRAPGCAVSRNHPSSGYIRNLRPTIRYPAASRESHVEHLVCGAHWKLPVG